MTKSLYFVSYRTIWFGDTIWACHVLADDMKEARSIAERLFNADKNLRPEIRCPVKLRVRKSGADPRNAVNT